MGVLKTLQLLSLVGVVAVRSETFDVVIAGGGTAGLVVASRLSELPDISIAVIEPGDDVRQLASVEDVNFSFSTFNTSMNYQYQAVLSPRLGSRNVTYRAGKAVGGTSIVNGMVLIRGDKAQYDAWEELGNKGWNWESVFSYDKKSEHFVPPTEAQSQYGGAAYDASAHGFDGPLDVGFPGILSNSSFYGKARATWQALGLQPIPELNGGDPHGFAAAPMTLDPIKDVRSDSATAYYAPAESRPNLKIIKGTVKRITWAEGAGKAVANGVEYVSPSGELVKIEAKKEVVVSASAYRSPLVLESSGIGNPKILSKLGIETKVDLPGVGESLQDHNIMAFTYNLASNITGRIQYATMPTAHDVFGDKTRSIADATYKKLGEWSRTLSATTGGGLTPAAIERRFRVQHDLIFNQNVTIAEIFPSNTGGSIFAQFWTSMPFSWGNVHLGSKDDIETPVITPNIMATDYDVQILTAVGRLMQKAYATAPLSELISANTFPGYDKLPLDASDEQWAAVLKANVLNALHVVGSCAMLPKELGGVVDTEARVYGTKNVRVVDASIVPMEVSGHTMAPVYGVAEKAADLIKASLK